MLKKYWWVIVVVAIIGILVWRKQKTGKYFSFDEYGDDEYGGKSKKISISNDIRFNELNKRIDQHEEKINNALNNINRVMSKMPNFK